MVKNTDVILGGGPRDPRHSPAEKVVDPADAAATRTARGKEGALFGAVNATKNEFSSSPLFGVRLHQLWLSSPKNPMI